MKWLPPTEVLLALSILIGGATTSKMLNRINDLESQVKQLKTPATTCSVVMPTELPQQPTIAEPQKPEGYYISPNDPRERACCGAESPMRSVWRRYR